MPFCTFRGPKLTERERESIRDGQELFAEVVIVCMGIYTVLVVGSDN